MFNPQYEGHKDRKTEGRGKRETETETWPPTLTFPVLDLGAPRAGQRNEREGTG